MIIVKNGLPGVISTLDNVDDGAFGIKMASSIFSFF